MVILASAWTITNVSTVREIVGRTLTQDMRRVELVLAMRLALHRHHRAAVLYMLGERDSSRAMAVESQETFLHNLELAEAIDSDVSSREVLRDVRRSYRVFALNFIELGHLNEEQNRIVPMEELGEFYRTEILTEVDSISSHLRRYGQFLANRMTADIEQVSSNATFTLYSSTAIAVLLLGLSVFAAWKATESILRPIHRLSDSVQTIAGGSNIAPIDVGDAYAELAELVGHFNSMTLRLAEQQAVNSRLLATEQLRAEKIVRDLPDLTIVTDGDRRVMYFNHQAEVMLGLRARRVIGSRLDDFKTENEIIGMLAGDLDSERVDQEPLVHTMTVGGVDRSYSYGLQTVRSEGGEIVGYLFRMQDVTSFRKVDDLRKKMISTVSHELRTPLTSMGMSLELLLEEGMGGNLDDLQRELLGNLHEDVKRLGAFVNDLLDLSRIDTGRASFRFESVSPRTLADDVARRFAPIAIRQEIQIDTTGVAHDLPHVSVDTGRIGQVLSNLLTNAIRYTPYRGTISVGAVVDGIHIRFWVRDNGPGIPADEAERVFDRFYQIRDDQRAGGSGLGLSIVKEIVEAHRGKVWVQSAAGFGSSFNFTLPLSDEGHSPSIRQG